MKSTVPYCNRLTGGYEHNFSSLMSFTVQWNTEFRLIHIINRVEMKKILTALVVILTMGMVSQIVQAQTTVPEEIGIIFQKATRVREVKNVWYTVYDASNKILGYAAYSKPHSDGIAGFNGETPLLVCFDVNYRIIKVVLLENQETPGYVRLVKESTLFHSWDGLSIREALVKTPETVSGATYTSSGVIESMRMLLMYLDENAPTKDKKKAAVIR